jgi:hypothetical protein
MTGLFFLILIRAMPLASMPDEAEGDLQEFIEDLVQRGLAGYEVEKI